MINDPMNDLIAQSMFIHQSSVSEKFKDSQWNQLPADLLPRISRLVGAFIERTEVGSPRTAVGLLLKSY